MLTFKLTGDPLKREDQLFHFVQELIGAVDASKKATHTVVIDLGDHATVKLRVRFMELIKKTRAPRKEVK